MKVKTSQLTGLALNWAVCIAEGNTPVFDPVRFGSVSYGMFESELGYAIKLYCTSSSEAGEMLKKYKMDLEHSDGVWSARHPLQRPKKSAWVQGSTLGEALCRCLVRFKLGDEVEIPERLLK